LTELGRLSAARYYDRISAAYDLIADAAEHDARERGLRLLAIQPGESVLELGAGTGRALETLSRGAGSGGQVFGLDASSGMLAIAGKRIASNRGATSLQQGDARTLPYHAASFDAAFMSFTLELFEPLDIDLVLHEVARVLRGHGRIVIVSLAATREPGLMSQAYVWLHRHFPHFIDCRPIDVQDALNVNGFAVSGADEMTLWGLPVTAVLAHLASPPTL
jgi:ubiquinone/menaquinone biosynthesis C-methylase UbiE